MWSAPCKPCPTSDCRVGCERSCRKFSYAPAELAAARADHQVRAPDRPMHPDPASIQSTWRVTLGTAGGGQAARHLREHLLVSQIPVGAVALSALMLAAADHIAPAYVSAEERAVTDVANVQPVAAGCVPGAIPRRRCQVASDREAAFHEQLRHKGSSAPELQDRNHVVHPVSVNR